MKCPDCGMDPCDNDCGELREIYREHHKQQMRDVILDDDDPDYPVNHTPHWDE